MNLVKNVIVAVSMVVSSSSFAGDMIVNDAKIKMAKSGQSTGAFMVIKNETSVDDVLLSVKSDVAKRTELHLTKISSDGMAKMVHQKGGVPISKGADLVLKHGSYHVMLMGLKQDINNDKVKLILNFKNSGEVIVFTEPFSMKKKMH